MQPQFTIPSNRLLHCYGCRQWLSVSSFPTPMAYRCNACYQPRPKPDPVNGAATTINCVCQHCGTSFVYQYHMGQVKRFCSLECRKKAYKARPHAKVDAQRHNIKRAYGLTWEQAKALYDAQGGKCALCLQDISWEGRERAIDHDHATGKVRGILCRGCNQMLGYLERLSVSRRAWLTRAEAYLKETSS